MLRIVVGKRRLFFRRLPLVRSLRRRASFLRKSSSTTVTTLRRLGGDACPTQDVALTALLWAERESSSVPPDARGTAAVYHDMPHFRQRDRRGVEYTNPVGNDYLANLSIQNATDSLVFIGKHPISSPLSIRRWPGPSYCTDLVYHEIPKSSTSSDRSTCCVRRE
ncbi:hypothetical protein FKP32DRAFT_197148 [Trametes sanguinea]|nr:hypothetical protein FKP32DRAFT_197148 [Trametes sanguinea]